jgi:hypothetical protein
VETSSADWSILFVLPTAVKEVIEGEGEVREFATGSTTSSTVASMSEKFAIVS